MSADVFLDTNILIYATGADGEKTDIARELVSAGGRISVQVMNEFVNVARRKVRWSWPDTRAALAALCSALPDPLPLDINTHARAMDICERYRLPFYDSLIVASALRSGCKTLVTEDLQDGQVIDGLAIHNPFRRI